MTTAPAPSASGPAGPIPSLVGGARVLRRVHAGERADLLLLEGGHVVAKVFRDPGLGPTSGELSALVRVDHRHVVRLLDVETLADGRVAALLARCGGGTLADWLAGRTEISPGEAVTVLAPVAGAVEALRAAGVVHGRIAADRVLLDEQGAPVLVGFGSARIAGEVAATGAALPGRPHAHPDDVDAAALRALATSVLARVNSPSAAAISARLSAMEEWELPGVLIDALFSFSPGEPLSTARTPPIGTRPSSTGSHPARSSAPPPDRALAVRVPRRLARIAAELDADPRARLLALVRDRWAAAPPALRRAGIAVAAGAIAAGVVAASIPDGDSARAERGTGTAAPPTASAVARVPKEGPTPADSSPSDPDSVVRGTDAVAALPILLAARERCLREPDDDCLASVDEDGSPAAETDAAALSSTSDPVMPRSADLTATQSLGGAVLFSDAGATVRVLLVATVDGWRIRELRAADP